MVTKIKGSVAEPVVQKYNSRTDMKDSDAPVGAVLYLNEGGRSGEFIIKSGTPPSDPQEGIYVVLANGNYAERVRASRHFDAGWYGLSSANTAADNNAAWSAFVTACTEGAWATVHGNSYELTQTGHAFSAAVTLECLGHVNLNLNATDSGNFLEFAWSAGKPYANHVKGMLTINANGTGGDTLVMRGINWSVDDRVVVRNAGRDGFVLRTSDTNNWFIENFFINQLEIDGAQRNGLTYDLALKSSGSFINEGLIQSLEVREAGKGGAGTEIAYLVPEDTYSANKVSSIVYVKTNIDLRSSTRTEPYALAVKKTGGATVGSTVEHQMFINGAWENVAGLISGSAAVFVDTNTACNNWKFFDVFTSDLASFFAGTPLNNYFKLDRNGYITTSRVQTSGTTPAWRIGTAVDRLCQMLLQSGNSGLSGNVNNTADELILENSADAGMTILSPSTDTGRIAFGDEGSATSGQLRYLHSSDAMEQVTAGNKIIRQDNLGNVVPGATGAQDLGSESLRFQHAHVSRMKLLDGISAPAAVAGWAFLFVDSADGDLKVRFGDGVTKTIVTDV